MKFAAHATLEVKGQSIEEFDSVTLPEVENAKEVEYSQGKGYAEIKERFGTLKVEYLIPGDKPEFDFETVRNEPLTVQFDNGTRITYAVTHAKTGEAKADGKDKITKTIEFIVTGRTKE